MTSKDLRQKYLDFFKSKGHTIIPSASLVPENDPSTLFISAGMHPLVPYLLGQPHPQGRRLTNFQKCLRTDDIDEVGDPIHHTFFEMLGNWSLGDYFKKEAIEWSFEFLTSKEWLNIPTDKLAVSVFEGDDDAPFDDESYNFWLTLGIPEERIAKLPKKNNWWGPAGQTGPCGPDTEMFYWTGKDEAPSVFDPENPAWVEIWNDVFMQYNKNVEGKFELLEQKNVDTGMGLERSLAILNKLDDDYKTDLFFPLIQKLEELSGKKYDEHKRHFRVIADHIKAAVFLASEEISLSSKDQRGAILRRLLDRSISAGQDLNLDTSILPLLGNIVIQIYRDACPKLLQNKEKILDALITIGKRINQIRTQPTSVVQNLREILNQPNNQITRELEPLFTKHTGGAISPSEFLSNNKYNSLATVYAGTIAFDAKTTYGYPTTEVEHIARQELGKGFIPDEFSGTIEALNQEHKKKSQIGGEKIFKGGLADSSEITTKYHTTTHLLHAALRQVLGTHVQQKGSNITAERLRFDFSHQEKLTEEELKKVEELVNQKVREALPVSFETMDKEEALNSGALGFFTEKYGDKVSVYTIGHLVGAHHDAPSVFSKEICGGPHVTNTSQIGSIKIIKEESAGAGIRRIYAILN